MGWVDLSMLWAPPVKEFQLVQEKELLSCGSYPLEYLNPQGEIASHLSGLQEEPEDPALPDGLRAQWGSIPLEVVGELKRESQLPPTHASISLPSLSSIFECKHAAQGILGGEVPKS